MKLALIAPTKYLKYTELGDLHFVLAQEVLRDEEYCRFYANSNKFKLMDNGAYEGVLLSTEQLLEAGEKARVQEIVAPDIPSDPALSFKLTKEFLDVAPIRRFSYVGIPHGKTLSEYEHYFNKMLSLPINTIGLSILDLHKFEEKQRLRPMVVHYLRDLLNDVNVHLFGLDEPLELFCYSDMPIRSVDTSLPFSLALLGKRITLMPEKHQRISFSYKDILDEHLLKRNINDLLNWCHHV